MRRFLGICLVSLCLATTVPAFAGTEAPLTTRLTVVVWGWLKVIVLPSESCDGGQVPTIEVGGGMDPNG